MGFRNSLPVILGGLILLSSNSAPAQQKPGSGGSAAAPSQLVVAMSQPASPDAVMEHAMPSMALILTGDGAGNSAPAACAFIRRPDGVLLTTYQAVINVHQLRVMLTNGQAYEKAEIIASDERRNVAALRVQASRLPVLPAGASEELKAGDTVYALYGSAATAWVIVPVVFQAVRMSDEVSGAGHGYRLLEFAPPVAPRLNGGVLLDVQGHALGMLVSFSGARNAGYAVPLESIAGLADASPATISTQFAEAAAPP